MSRCDVGEVGIGFGRFGPLVASAICQNLGGLQDARVGVWWNEPAALFFARDVRTSSRWAVGGGEQLSRGGAAFITIAEMRRHKIGGGGRKEEGGRPVADDQGWKRQVLVGRAFAVLAGLLLPHFYVGSARPPVVV